MTYLLDTNVCISFLRGGNPAILGKFQSHVPGELATCSTVRSELIFGALRSRNPEDQLEVVRRFLLPLTCYDFNEATADMAAKIRSELVHDGNVIGPYDLQIAATALQQNLTLVAHNVSEFSRVAGLKIEDWES